jgi:hypothetical protein
MGSHGRYSGSYYRRIHTRFFGLDISDAAKFTIFRGFSNFLSKDSYF